MSRQNRIDFAGATHVVRINGRRGSDVFFDVSILRDSPGLWTQHVVGVAHLEYLLDEVCDEYSAPVHAYVIGPNFLELVMQTPAAPLEWVLRDLRARFAKFVRRQKGISAGSVYQGRYRAKVLDPSLLPFAMRRAHALPVYYGLVQCPGDYPFSSYRAYCGADAPRWLKREAVLDALQARGYMGVEGFRTFSNRPSSPHMTRLFEDGFTLNRKIIGTAVFAQFARQQAQQTRVAPSRDDLLERVALLLGASQDIVYRKTRAGALARALVAWYASRTGAASRTEVGRWFRVTGSALRHVIE